jgi:hypothetical protein
MIATKHLWAARRPDTHEVDSKCRKRRLTGCRISNNLSAGAKMTASFHSFLTKYPRICCQGRSRRRQCKTLHAFMFETYIHTILKFNVSNLGICHLGPLCQAYRLELRSIYGTKVHCVMLSRRLSWSAYINYRLHSPLTFLSSRTSRWYAF